MKNIVLSGWMPSFTESTKFIFLAVLAITFLVELILHLRLQMTTDGAFLHYVAFLINEHGFVPYRDIFEFNMPGTYLFHMGIGQLLGYSNIAYYMVSAIWLTLTLIVTWLFMQTINKAVALAACLLFGLIYLQIAPNYMALQRDFVLILPIATAILLSINPKSYHSIHFLHFLLGILFAVAALFKPHAVIGLPFVIAFSLINAENSVSIQKRMMPFIRGCLMVLLGILLTLALTVLWLWEIDALASFWRLLTTYTPLYAQMSGDFEFQGTFDRLWYIASLYMGLGGFGWLLIGSLLGLLFIFIYATSTKTKKLAALLLVLTIIYSLYATVGGKLWLYHWMPFIYFASLSATMLLFSPPDKTYQQVPYPKILPVLIVISIAIMYLPITQFAQLKQKLADIPVIHEQIRLHNQDVHLFSPPATNEIITKTTQYLNTHLETHDTVQPLGWISGITQAMLFSEAVLATPYINDFQFYHHVSHPYIKQLRTDFIQRLQQQKPKFIIKVQEGAPFKPKMLGADVSYEFPELATFIQQHYEKSYSGNGFVIFRRNQ